MAVNRAYTRPSLLCWGLVALAGMGSGCAMGNLVLGAALFLCVAAEGISSHVLARHTDGLWALRLSVATFPPALAVVLLVTVAHSYVPPQVAVPLMGALIAEVLLLLNRGAQRDALVTTAILTTAHIFVLAVVGQNTVLFLVILTYFFLAISFWLQMQFAAYQAEPSLGGTASPLPAGTASWRNAFLLLVGLGTVVATTLFLFTPRRYVRSADVAAGTTVRPHRDHPPEPLEFREASRPRDGSTRDAPPVRNAGFREAVNLLGRGRVLLDQTPIMTVRCLRSGGSPFDPADGLYVRGITLETYRGGRWTHELLFEAVEDAGDGAEDGWTLCGQEPSEGREAVLQEFLLDPIGADAIFAVPDVVAISTSSLLTDSAGSIRFTSQPRGRVRYQAISHVAVDRQGLPRIDPAAMHPMVYTQLPRGIGRIARLAREVTAGERTGAGKCRRVEAFLKAHAAYTLENVPSHGGDPVDAFLFVTRRGRCAHYAAAMVIMLRCLRIPCRMACGFVSSERVAGPGTFIVRRAHAHAWVEVHGGRAGWLRFDPSPDRDAGWQPGSGSEPEEQPGVTGQGWVARLVRYGEQERQSVVQATMGVLQRFWWFVVVGAGGSVAIVLGARRRRRRRNVTTALRLTDGTTGDFYGRFLQLVVRAGIRCDPSWTPHELAGQAAGILPEEPVRVITETFCAVRYGKRPFRDEAKRRVREALAAIREAIRGGPPQSG